MTEEQLSVGVLLPGEHLHRWAVNAVTRMTRETNAEVTLLVIDEGSTSVVDDSSLDISLWLERIIETLRTHRTWAPFVVKRTLFPPEHAQSVPIDSVDAFADAERISCTPLEADGAGNRLPSDVVETIGDEVDVVIRFGFGILKGAVLTAPEYGVLSFHHGDIRKYRGRAGGFWEFVNGDDVAGVTLQRLNETLDGGEIIAFETVDATDVATYSELRSRLYRTSEGMLSTGIRNLQREDFTPTVPETLGPLLTSRDSKHVAIFLLKSLLGRINLMLADDR